LLNESINHQASASVTRHCENWKKNWNDDATAVYLIYAYMASYWIRMGLSRFCCRMYHALIKSVKLMNIAALIRPILPKFIVVFFANPIIIFNKLLIEIR
jgi:hypothetical protein